MKHHRNKAKTTLNRLIYAHLQQHQTDFSAFSITIIDQVKDLKKRKEKEMQYIQNLKIKVPFGLNVINTSVNATVPSNNN